MRKNHDELKKLNKKELKNYINQNGFFTTATIETNAPQRNDIPEGAVYFKAIASNGELNRNGYIIRESAWVNAINGFMANPVLLLQHDMDKPIGKVLNAMVTTNGLEIEAYAFDDYTEGRLGRGLLNAISTGHYTEKREFENQETKEIKSEEEFLQLSIDERMSGDWIMAVTELEMLECSLVSIGSNRKSLITHKEAMKNYINTLQEEATEEVEEVTEEVTETEAEEAEVEEEDTSTDEAETVEAETPDADEVDENSIKSEAITITQSEKNEINQLISQMAQTIEARDKEINELRVKLKNTPLHKGRVNAQVEKPASPLATIFQQNGLKINQ